MISRKRIYATEYAVIILLWAIVVISPLLFMDGFNDDWEAVHIMWAECSVVAVAFIVNRFFLASKLFFAQRYIEYLVAIIFLFLLLSIFVLYFDGVNLILLMFDRGYLAQDSFEMAMKWEYDGIVSPPIHPPMTKNSVIPPAVSVLILSAITIMLDNGVGIGRRWVMAERTLMSNNQERMLAQLSNLQSQVSPHFFMNTLNNIHALVDIDSQRAKQTIIELSNLMSYLLYECSSKSMVPLQRELEFIDAYINLMRLRYAKQVAINFASGDNPPSVEIPPLLFLNFIENAFKYGVDYEQESFIKIKFSYDNEGFIEMSAINSNHSASVNNHKYGFGIANSRKRLDMLYGDKYELQINDKQIIYMVTLKIPIR